MYFLRPWSDGYPSIRSSVHLLTWKTRTRPIRSISPWQYRKGLILFCFFVCTFESCTPLTFSEIFVFCHAGRPNFSNVNFNLLSLLFDHFLDASICYIPHDLPADFVETFTYALTYFLVWCVSFFFPML